MAVSRIFLWLGFAFIVYAGLLLMAGLSGFLMGETVPGQVFLGLSALLGILGAIVYFTSQNAPRRERPRDALIFLILFWAVIPIATSLPFLTLGVVSSPVQGYFESVSAITTTGASTLTPENLPRSLLVWRSALQWSGGCFVAVFAVVILAALNLSGPGVHRSVFFTLKTGELFSRLVEIGRIVIGIYAVISLLCFALLTFSGTPAFEAFCLSLSAVATGGLAPRSGPLYPYVSNFGAVVLAFTCLLGAVNLSLLWDIARKRDVQAFIDAARNVESRGMFVMIGLIIILGLFYGGFSHLHTFIVEAVFIVSTAGYDYHVIGVDILRPSILIAFALIGGSALSTAGGIKVIRMLLLLRHLRTDLDRMSHPLRVRPVRFQGRIIEDKAFLSIWMYFLGYTMVFAGGVFALGGSGLEFTHAVAASASALSNMGPLVTISYPEFSYGQMNPFSLWFSAVIMILGRVEVLAALAVFSPSVWRNS